jgi:hypothetical protein
LTCGRRRSARAASRSVASHTTRLHRDPPRRQTPTQHRRIDAACERQRSRRLLCTVGWELEALASPPTESKACSVLASGRPVGRLQCSRQHKLVAWLRIDGAGLNCLLFRFIALAHLLGAEGRGWTLLDIRLGANAALLLEIISEGVVYAGKERQHKHEHEHRVAQFREVFDGLRRGRPDLCRMKSTIRCASSRSGTAQGVSARARG